MSSPTRHRVFLVEDHAVVREVLTEFLSRLPDIDVCGTAASGEEALPVLLHDGCDVALVDVSMPGMSGVDLVRTLRERGARVRCLMLSAHRGMLHVDRALEAGAVGYVLKNSSQELEKALRQVLEGA